MNSQGEMGGFPPGFGHVRGRARKLLRDPVALARLAARAEESLRRRRGALEGVVDELATLTRLLRAWAHGTYRDVRHSTLVAVVAAVLYFLMPLDAIPDIVAGIGLADDAMVIAWVVERVRAELDAFRRWEADRSGVSASRGEYRGEGAQQAGRAAHASPVGPHGQGASH